MTYSVTAKTGVDAQVLLDVRDGASLDGDEQSHLV
jgi:hypothetical protein